MILIHNGPELLAVFADGQPHTPRDVAVACNVPTTPTTDPSTPTSAQLGTVPGGGASGKRQR